MCQAIAGNPGQALPETHLSQERPASSCAGIHIRQDFWRWPCLSRWALQSPAPRTKIRRLRPRPVPPTPPRISSTLMPPKSGWTPKWICARARNYVSLPPEPLPTPLTKNIPTAAPSAPTAFPARSTTSSTNTQSLILATARSSAAWDPTMARKLSRWAKPRNTKLRSAGACSSASTRV